MFVPKSSRENVIRRHHTHPPGPPQVFTKCRTLHETLVRHFVVMLLPNPVRRLPASNAHLRELITRRCSTFRARGWSECVALRAQLHEVLNGMRHGHGILPARIALHEKCRLRSPARQGCYGGRHSSSPSGVLRSPIRYWNLM
jgi:hypothetical protein